MKTLIAIPCMSTVPTGFMTAMLGMDRPEGSMIAVTEGTLIHTARNILAKQALEGGFDRILWLDSDMRPPRDLMRRLSEHMDDDDSLQFVCGLYFKRRLPLEPAIYKSVEIRDRGIGKSEIYEDYPMDTLFQIAAAGFGAVMMTTRLYDKAAQRVECGNPFLPLENLGEDLAFCLRAAAAGGKLYCDSSIKVPHIGYIDYTEDMT